MTTIKATLPALLVSIFFCTAAIAKVSVYLNDGGEIQAQKAWLDNGTVHVLVNRDTKVEFEEREVDLQKTKLRAKPRNKLLDQVIEASGTRQQLENLLKQSSTDDEFDQVLKESYNPAMAVKVVRKHFAKKLSEQNLADVLAWLKSPVGRKITKAETLPDPDGKEKMKAFMDREATPEMKERMQILEEIERNEGTAEMERGAAARMIRRIAKAIPVDFPNRASVLGKLNDNVPPLEKLRKENAAKSAYTLRDISTAELRDYLQFQRSPAGAAYSEATINAAREIFSAVMDKLGDKLIKDMEGAMAEAQNSDAAAASPTAICAYSASEGRKKLPFKIDAVTTATDISCESTTLVYQYRIRNSYTDTFMANLAGQETSIKAKICGNAGLVETHFSKGVSVKYLYYDESGKTLSSFVVTPAVCGI